MSPTPQEGPGTQEAHLEVPLDTFTAEALRSESERLGVSRQEIVLFAIAYYLADLDSGRIARRITGRARGPGPGADAPPR